MIYFREQMLQGLRDLYESKLRFVDDIDCITSVFHNNLGFVSRDRQHFHNIERLTFKRDGIRADELNTINIYLDSI